MKVLYEVLVPTKYGDNGKPIRTAHHKQWDKYVKSITGGLTILAPAKGQWVNEGVEYPERVLPVRVMVEETMTSQFFDNIWNDVFDTEQIDKIIQFTLAHYRQKAVMYYVISNQVNIIYAK